jgi:hypothetical protein
MHLRILIARFFGKRHRRSESDIEDEFAAHLEIAAADLRAQGMGEEEAAREARIRFGGITQNRESYRRQSRPPIVDSIVADLSYAARQLRRNPGFAIVAVLTLALGIGATTAIYSLVQAVLLHSLPYGRAEQLVYLYMPNAHLDAPPEVMTPSDADFFDIQRMSHSFQSMTAFGQKIFNLSTPNTIARVSAATVDAQFFSTFETVPTLGRAILQKDNLPGQDHVVIISRKLWHSLFAENADVLTRSIILDGSPYRIIGVMPRDFEYPTFSDLPYGNASVHATDIWVPLALTPQQAADRESANLYTVARLKPGITIARAEAEMSAIVRQLTPLHKWYSSGWSAKIESLRDNTIGPVRPLLLLLLASTNLASAPRSALPVFVSSVSCSRKLCCSAGSLVSAASCLPGSSCAFYCDSIPETFRASSSLPWTLGCCSSLSLWYASPAFSSACCQPSPHHAFISR